MRNLLNFILRYGTWFLFVFYVTVSCILLFSTNSYQQAVFLTSANTVSSSINSSASSVTGYFHLKSINKSLQASNARLENEVLNLRSQLAETKALLSDSLSVPANMRFDFTPASVVTNSVRHPRNFFSINKGSDDGIKIGMGVVDQNGVIGIVNVVGRKTARVISLLNETQHFSVKLKDTDYIGSLNWRGGDPAVAYMDQVSRHTKFNTGDTVMTNGFSTTFPEGIPVGTVMNRVKGSDDNFFILKVKLNSDFRALSTVRVIKDQYKEELDSLSSLDNITTR